MLPNWRRFVQIRKEGATDKVYLVFENDVMPEVEPGIELRDITEHIQFDEIQPGWLYNRLLDTYGEVPAEVATNDDLQQVLLDAMLAVLDLGVGVGEIVERVAAIEKKL